MLENRNIFLSLIPVKEKMQTLARTYNFFTSYKFLSLLLLLLFS